MELWGLRLQIVETAAKSIWLWKDSSAGAEEIEIGIEVAPLRDCTQEEF